MSQLNTKPWRDLLPNNVRATLQFRMMQDFKGAENKSGTFFSSVQQHFERFDTDRSGTIDALECVEMVKVLYGQRSKVPLTREQIVKWERDAHESLGTFGEDGETVTLGEFCAMMGSNPWLTLLPREAKDEVILKKAAFLAERPKRGNTGERSAAKQVHTAAKHIFNEVRPLPDFLL